MPYSIAWDEATPTDATDADLIDDNFRSLKESISERMDDILVEDWSADPVVLKAGVSGAKSKQLVIGPYDFSQEDNQDYTQDDEFIRSDYLLTAKVFRASVKLPPGVTITAFQAMVNPGGGAMSVVFGSTPFDAGATGLTTIATANSSASGKTEVEVASLSYTTDEDDQLLIKATLTVNQRLYGCRILYDAPDSGATI